MKSVTKSQYTAYLKCPKMLWYSLHGEPGAVSDVTLRTLDSGTAFGELARSYFGPYVLANRNSEIPVTEQTRRFLESGEPTVAEASFACDGCFCMADILHRNESGAYDLIEVKSTSSMKPEHIDDIAFQYRVISRCVPVGRCILMHLNGEYRRSGDLTAELFALEDVTGIVKDAVAGVVKKPKKGAPVSQDPIGDAVKVISCMDAAPLPGIRVHANCDDPWECPYKAQCLAALTDEERALASITGLTWKQRIKCIEAGKPVYPKGKEVLTMPDNEEKTDPPAIREFLDTVRYPLYLLDFESIQNIVPQYDGQKPWQQTPFQYSLHIVPGPGAKESELIHREFLWDTPEDPRPALVKRLCGDIPSDACVMAYNMSFERGIIADLAVVYPEYAGHLEAIRENCIDLMEPFRKKDYYKGVLRTSYSIKQVLPCCCPDDPSLDYHSLDEVQNGTMAQEKYLELIALEPSPRKDELRRNMLAYCRLDTFAMYKLLKFLYGLV